MCIKLCNDFMYITSHYYIFHGNTKLAMITKLSSSKFYQLTVKFNVYYPWIDHLENKYPATFVTFQLCIFDMQYHAHHLATILLNKLIRYVGTW